MQWWEVKRYINGIRRSERTLWETSRFIGLVTASCNRDPKKPPLTASDLLPLPWDNKQTDDKPTDEEIEELREMMRKENAKRL